MELRDKIEFLGQASEFDLCSDGSIERPARRHALRDAVATALMPGGRCIKLLKVLLTNICENDCAYCAMRASHDTPRQTLRPQELARTFDEMRRAGLVQGLFLSSGICGRPAREMDRMLVAVEIVRQVYEFRGYIHLKILPGAEPAQIERAAQLADRISTNLEAPSATRLARLSDRKAFDAQLMPALQVASAVRRQSGGRLAPAGVTTQFVVGASDESDQEILVTAARLYGELGLARAYYSALRPVAGTPLEDHAPTPKLRQHRLYQSDFLLRRYGYAFHDLVFDGQGNLPSERDPKQAWADRHPDQFPIEVNVAGREQLLRVPGIGPLIAERIIRERRRGRLTDLSHLHTMGANVARAGEYVLLDGRRPARQLSLWD